MNKNNSSKKNKTFMGSKKKNKLNKTKPRTTKKKTKLNPKIGEKIIDIIETYNNAKKFNILFIICYLKIKKKIKNKIDYLTQLLQIIKQKQKIKNKNCDLKPIYDSYKDNLKELHNLKRKIEYFTYISKPIISEEELQLMIKQQSNMVDNISKLSRAIPKF